MLLTNDMGILFATMQAAYGHQWAHKADAIPVWQAKLNGYTAKQVMEAASIAIERHSDFPPSVGQFLDVLKAQKKPPNNYLPAPKYDKVNADLSWDYMERLAGKKLRPKGEVK